MRPIKPLFSFYLLFFGLLSACDSSTDTSSRLLPEPDLLERLHYQKAAIDNQTYDVPERWIILAKLREQPEPVLLELGDSPKNVERTYHINTDTTGRIVAIWMYPFRANNDADTYYAHYFDKNGHTFAFEKWTRLFSGECRGGTAYETKTEFYDNNLQLVGKEYKLVDEANKSLDKDSCVIPKDAVDYQVSPTLEAFLETHRMKKEHR